MAYAALTDVTDRWGPSASSDYDTVITTRLADVERMINKRIPTLADKTEDADFLADLIMVEADAVLRLVKNIDGYVSETDGDYTYQVSEALASGKLEILPEEWETLGVTSSGMFVIVATPVVST